MNDNKTTAPKQEQVIAFLNSLPKYKSHYGSSEKLYLNPNLSKDKLYNLYAEQVPAEMKVSKPIFNKFFKDYNISIYVHRMDTCKYCDEFKVLQDQCHTQRPEIVLQQREHHQRAEQARLELQLAEAEAKANHELLVFTFDMEKTQPLPKMNTSVVFYKRQLWVYNVGIHTCHDNQGFMCLWTEGEAKRGSSEVCSSIFSFLRNISLENYSKVKTFSDCCSGQNRNRNIVAFFMYLCHQFDISEWEHIYMESGHSYLPNDRDFAAIEKAAKRSSHIYSFDEWVTIVKSARKAKPFKVIEMNSNFISVQSLIKTTKTMNISFMKLSWFTVTNATKTVAFNLKDDPEVKSCDLSDWVADFDSIELPSLSALHPISAAKYQDLISLLPYIPTIHHDFYKNLLSQWMCLLFYSSVYFYHNFFFIVGAYWTQWLPFTF